MRHRANARRRARSGFTVVEVAISLGVFGVIGYGLIVVTGASHDSQAELVRVASDNRCLRDSSRLLFEELHNCSEDVMEVQEAGDGNCELTLQHSLVTDAGLAWGVFDATRPAGEQELPGWSVRYLVVEQPLVGGGTSLQLRRQLLDDAGQIQEAQVVLDGLSQEQGEDAGFRVQKVGAVWQVNIRREGHGQAARDNGLEFHVRPIN